MITMQASSHDRTTRQGARVFLFVLMLPLALAVFAGCSKKEEKEAKPPAEVQDPGLFHFQKGVEHSLRGEYDQAIAAYESSLEYNPHNAASYNNIGFAYLDKGDVEKAVEYQRKALQMDPNLANGYYGLALALEKRGGEGDIKEAVRNWNEFKKRSEPGSKWWLKAEEHLKALEGGVGKEGAPGR